MGGGRKVPGPGFSLHGPDDKYKRYIIYKTYCIQIFKVKSIIIVNYSIYIVSVCVENSSVGNLSV